MSSLLEISHVVCLYFTVNSYANANSNLLGERQGVCDLYNCYSVFSEDRLVGSERMFPRVGTYHYSPLPAVLSFMKNMNALHIFYIHIGHMSWMTEMTISL